MTITVSGRHMEVTPPLKAHAEQKASKLTKYYDLIQEIEVKFDVGKDDTCSVEMIVHAEHRNTFIAHHSGQDGYLCVDTCVHKLERQLTEHKQKFRNRKHSGEQPKQ
ncbi:MAG TPA: ribosome-associated translation inhibitor RaiA [Humisphaera sp.]|nr:ribosome-associated translation inhibitor RaiA [Humisphaera sp.]